MVKRLCFDGAAIQVVVGPPGTGKTFALAAAREAWEQSGFKVLGALVARRAAMELTASSGIDATSVAALLADLRQAPGELLDAETVLVVDEAEMLGTRPLDELVRHTNAAGAKLVLVGDHAQLPEIDAGGVFRALASRTAAIRLDVNRRQEREADRELLDLWRSGQLRQALSVAVDGGDLVMAPTPEDAYRQIVSDYCAAHATGEDAVMLAPSRAEVAHLNRLARGTLLEAGRVDASGIEVHGRTFASGDRIVVRRNDRRLGVENGTRGHVVAADPKSQSLTIALPDGTERALPSRFIHLRTRSGRSAVEHGYAMTAHLAQGMTTDRTFVLGSETIYREWGYVAWSRARRSTRFYAVEAELEDEHHTAAGPSNDRFGELVRRLDRSEAQQVGSDALPDRRADAAKHGRVIHLHEALGPRPPKFRHRRRWDRAARRIERFRARHGIVDPVDALGHEPAGRLERLAWRTAQREIQRYHLEAGDGRSRGSGRSIV